MVCFANFATFDHRSVISHSRAFSTATGVSSRPAGKQRIMTSAPALRRISANRSDVMKSRDFGVHQGNDDVRSDSPRRFGVKRTTVRSDRAVIRPD
jgi:hypothetical protein